MSSSSPIDLIEDTEPESQRSNNPDPDHVSPEILRDVPLSSVSLSLSTPATEDISMEANEITIGSIMMENNQTKEMTNNSSASLSLIALEPEYNCGSPGNTPFPFRSNPKYILNASISPDEIRVPVNSPEDNENSAAAISIEIQAKEQQDKLKNQLEQAFKTPERPGIPKTRKRLRDQMMSEEAKNTGGEAADQATQRDRSRKKRLREAMERLQGLVPGLDELNNDSEKYELIAKYLVFLREKVGSIYDEDFLKSVLHN